MALEIKTKIKIDLEKLNQKIKRKITTILMAAGYLIEYDAKNLCPVDTGRLRASIHTEPVDWNMVKVGTNVVYARAVEYGTVPHWPPIEPLKRWAKRHGLPEQAAYAIQASIAKHGTQPQPFMTPAYMMNREKIKKLIRKEIRNLIKESKT